MIIENRVDRQVIKKLKELNLYELMEPPEGGGDGIVVLHWTIDERTKYIFIHWYGYVNPIDNGFAYMYVQDCADGTELLIADRLVESIMTEVDERFVIKEGPDGTYYKAQG